jgi:hypothetical protein
MCERKSQKKYADKLLEIKCKDLMQSEKLVVDQHVSK